MTKKRKKKRKKRIKGPLDDLNNWQFCNPENFIDELPHPFQMIVDIIEEDILKKVYLKIYEIEEMKNNPSYEGGLKSLNPSGIMEIDNVTAISSEENNGFCVIGNNVGDVYFMDTMRKNQIFKNESKKEKCVLSLSLRSMM